MEFRPSTLFASYRLVGLAVEEFSNSSAGKHLIAGYVWEVKTTFTALSNFDTWLTAKSICGVLGAITHCHMGFGSLSKLASIALEINH